MSQSAQVLSLDPLRDFHAGLSAFTLQASSALCAAELEIQRTLDWLHGQVGFWQRTARDCQEEVNRARAELAHRRSWGEGRGPGTTEPEIALRKAKQRLEHAEEKIATTRRWIRQLPEAIKQYEGVARLLGNFVESDLKQAIALLEKKLAALEAYAATELAPPPTASTKESS